MRSNIAADWAFGIRGAIENVVRKNYPQELRHWPFLQNFDFEAHKIAQDYMVIILKDKLSGIPAGPGEPADFSFENHPDIPPKLKEIELWQFYLRGLFSLREEDAPFLVPIRDSGKNDATKDYNLFTPEEQLFWNQQIFYVVSRYKAHLQSSTQTPPSQPINITYNVSGTNTRVNINSTDSSTNIVSTESTEIFNDLRQLISSIEDENEKERISTSIDSMESSYGSSKFTQSYQNFMECIATHMTIFSPLIPPLTALLS